MNRKESNDDAMRDRIWDTITESAKRRFDYAAMVEEFGFNPDNFLFAIIMGLAVREEKEIIVLKLQGQMMIIGFLIKKDEIQKMIEEYEKPFGLEILATRIANDMLQNGGDSMAVYTTINQMLY